MTNRDVNLVRTGNQLVARLEEDGERVLFLDNQSPFGISLSIREDKIYTKAVLVSKNMINAHGNPMWRARKQIEECLVLGFDQVVLMSVDTKSGKQTILNFNSKGRMAGIVRYQLTE